MLGYLEFDNSCTSRFGIHRGAIHILARQLADVAMSNQSLRRDDPGDYVQKRNNND